VERLDALATAAFPSGSALARALGWTQPRVSKIRTGRQVPTGPDIKEWVAACGGSETLADELIAQLAEGSAVWSPWRQQMADGAEKLQEQVADLIDGATVIRMFEPTMIPGLVQIEPYARALADILMRKRTPEERAAHVAQRMRNQQSLYDPRKRFDLLADESSLYRWPKGVDADMRRGQLDRLHAVVGMERVQLGFLPQSPDLEVWPEAPFTAYDRMVTAETRVGEANHFPGSEESDEYLEYMDEVWEKAVLEPAEVRAMLNRALEALR
jgi:X-X-X-Leu-X-X-Gly heptad repeat protein